MANDLEPQNIDTPPDKSQNQRQGRSDVSTPPSGFRTVSLIVSLSLLALLFAAILTAVVSNKKPSSQPIAAGATRTSTVMTATVTTVSETTAPIPTDEATEKPTTEPTTPKELPTNTPAPVDTSTATPEHLEPTATDTANPKPTKPLTAVRLAEPRRVEQAGFEFRPASDYALDVAGDSVTLSASERSVSAGTLLLMRTVEETDVTADSNSDLDNTFTSVIESMSSRQMLRSGEPEEIIIGGHTGQAVDLVEAAGGSGLEGRIAVVRPDADHVFMSVGFSPAQVWQDYARDDFDAMLNTVVFFTPDSPPETELVQVTPPSIAVDIATAAPTEAPADPETTEPPDAELTPEATSAPLLTPEVPFDDESVWLIASNGNFGNRIATAEDNVWAATDGGVVAWNKATGNFAKFTTLNGLAANKSVAVVDCPIPGFGIVFGTEQGLQVFDSDEGSWSLLNSDNSDMSYDEVSALYCDEDAGVLVVAYTSDGLDVYATATGEWTLLDDVDGLITGVVRNITVTDPLTIWIASQLGLTRFANGVSTLLNSENTPMSENAVTALAKGIGDTIWLATAGDLYRTDGETWSVFNAATTVGSDFPNGSITGIATVDDGTVWIGSDQTQICLFSPVTGSCTEFFSAEDGMAAAPLTSMHLDASGEVYYSTAGAGMSVLNGSGWTRLFIEEEPVTGNRIRAITGIDDGTVWVATNSGVSQINLLDGRPVRFFTASDTDLLSQDVRVVQPVSTDSAWFGTAGGVNFYDAPGWTSYTEEDGLVGSDVRALAVDSDNRVWVGTTAGLSIRTGNEFFNLTIDNGLPTNEINALQRGDDLMWIGTGMGLLRFQDSQLQVYNSGNINLPSDSITTLALDFDDSLLIGTDKGLARFRDNQIVDVPDIPAVPINSIAAGNSGELWVAANGDELYHFDGSTWIKSPRLDLLPSQSISSLYVDEKNDLWIGAAEGGLATITQ